MTNTLCLGCDKLLKKKILILFNNCSMRRHKDYYFPVSFLHHMVSQTRQIGLKEFDREWVVLGRWCRKMSHGRLSQKDLTICECFTLPNYAASSRNHCMRQIFKQGTGKAKHHEAFRDYAHRPIMFSVAFISFSIILWSTLPLLMYPIPCRRPVIIMVNDTQTIIPCWAWWNF